MSLTQIYFNRLNVLLGVGMGGKCLQKTYSDKLSVLYLGWQISAKLFISYRTLKEQKSHYSTFQL